MAKARVFTETWLRSLLKKRPTKRADYGELGRKGFAVRHHPGGTVSFVVRYQLGGTPRPPITLGTFPAMSLEQAHEEHAAIRRQLARHLDPAVEREAAAHDARRSRERERAANAVTVRNVVAEWAWHYARRERKHAREAVRQLHVYVVEPWAGRPARELTRRDAVLLLDRIKARAPVQANRVASLGAQAFTFAIQRDLLENNPFLGVKRPGGEEPPRERRLSDDEIRTMWAGLDVPSFKASRAVRLAIKLVLVTAQRPGEVAGLRWDELDLENALWTIPAGRSKNGREHRVPLSDLALELIEAARPLAKDRPHVFPSAHAKEKREEPMLELALSRALRNNRAGDGTIFGLPWFTPHDLRRSAASGMTQLGVSRLVAGKVLNHTDRDVTGRVYDLNEYAAEKRLALETWAEHLKAVIAGKAPKVTPIRAARTATA